MRQIRPRTNPPTVLPDPIRHLFSVDLRDHQIDSGPDAGVQERDLQAELDRTRSAVASLMGDLADLVNERENLKAQLAPSEADHLVFDADDQSVVPWGFFEDDDF